MSMSVKPIRESVSSLKRRRAKLLKEVGVDSPAELAERADRQVLSEREDAVAYQLESIAFLLGEEPLRIR